MYALIERNIDQLLSEIDSEKHVKRYVWLTGNLCKVDVSADKDYQKEYRSYWALNGAGLGKEWINAYFSKLEELKRNSESGAKPGSETVKEVVSELWKVPTNNKGYRSLQFSFASKLVHMVNTDLPLYDRMVGDFYFLPTGFAGKCMCARVRRFMESYNFLVEEYERVLDRGILNRSIEEFRRTFEPDSLRFSDVKVIDSLIWKCAALLRSRDIKYRSYTA
jgi:hypothetical protein